MKEILVVDDHPLVFGGLRDALGSRVGKPISLELAKTMAEARRRLLRNPVPALTLLDMQLAEGSGFTLVEELREEGIVFEFAVLTASRDWKELQRAVGLGACGFLLKEYETERLVAAIDDLLVGKRVFPEGAPDAVHLPKDLLRAFHTLTARERAVLQGLKDGLLNREVAVRLGIGVRTVETHRARACEKLEVHNSIQLSAVLVQLRDLLLDR